MKTDKSKHSESTLPPFHLQIRTHDNGTVLWQHTAVGKYTGTYIRTYIHTNLCKHLPHCVCKVIMLGGDLSKLLGHCEVQVTQLTKGNVLLHGGG